MNRVFSRHYFPFRRTFIRSFRFSVPFFLSLCLTACGSGSSTSTSSPNPNVPPSQPHHPQPVIAEIRIAPNSASFPVGARQQFVAIAIDEEGQPITGVDVTWESNDPFIASISPSGLVEGLQEGTTFVTAVFGEIRNSVRVEIISQTAPRPPIASIHFITSQPSLSVGDTFQFAAQARQANGNPIQGITFFWVSSRPEIVSIDDAGVATGLRTGSTEITASAEGISSPPLTVQVNEIQAPRVNSVTPRQGETAPPSVKPSVTFDQVIDTASLDRGWTIHSGTQRISGRIDCNTPCKTAVFTPSASGGFPSGLYTATVTSEIKNSGGVSFAGPFSWSFSVQPPPTPGGGWRKSAVPGDLFAVHFASPSEGWTAGLGQVIAHTTDGGASWTVQNNFVFNGSSPPSLDVLVDFYDLFFIDAQTGWAVGWPQAIFKTTDGGATWVEQHLHRGYWGDRNGDGTWDRRDWCEVWNSAGEYCSKKLGVYLRKVQFADRQYGWSVGRFGFIFKTENGGASWRAIPQNSAVRPLPIPCAYPAGHSLAGQPRTDVTSYNPHLFTLDVLSPNEVWIGGGSEGDEPCAAGWLRMLGQTTDGGQSWRFLYEAENGGQLEGNGRIFDMKFSRSADGAAGPIGWAVGGNGTARANALQTTDGGQTWRQVRSASNFSNAYYGLAFLSPSDIWMAGWGGLILHSGDGGASWRQQTSGTSSQLRRVFFFDQNNGWIAGQGQVFRTVSGGN